jgi:hypothetical protein
MAIKTDMNRVKEKWEEEIRREAARKSRTQQVQFWKAKPGTSHIRVLPPWTEEGPNAKIWWREIVKHYNVKAQESPDNNNVFMVTCASKTEDSWYQLNLPPNTVSQCLICDYINELQAAGEIQLANDMRAQIRYLMNIIDISDPVWTKENTDQLKLKNVPQNIIPKVGSPKIQIYEAPPTVMKPLLDFYSDKVDLVDIEKGHDIKIEREGTDKTTSYRVRPVITPSKAKYITDKDLDNLINLDQVSPFLTNEQIQMIFDGGTKKDVYSLTTSTSRKQLTESSPETEIKEEMIPEESGDILQQAMEVDETIMETSQEEEVSQEEVSQEEEAPQEEEEASQEEVPKWDFPLDSEGYVDHSKLSDKEMENPKNAAYMDQYGYSVYVECYGAARQRDENSETCSECALLERCGKRIEELDQKAAKKRTPPKRKPPAAKAETKSSKGNGGPENKAKETSPAPADKISTLEDEMRKALGN